MQSERRRSSSAMEGFDDGNDRACEDPSDKPSALPAPAEELARAEQGVVDRNDLPQNAPVCCPPARRAGAAGRQEARWVQGHEVDTTSAEGIRPMRAAPR